MKKEMQQAAESRENQLISKLLKAMTSDDSPYATHAQLQSVVSSIEAIVKHASPIPKGPPTPPRIHKRSKHQQDSNEQMETEIHAGDEKPPDELPNRQ
jgi:hypothetical protein